MKAPKESVIVEANLEAAGDVVTGAVVAKALGDGSSPSHASTLLCKNCKAPLAAKYCGACGQTAHPHRSLAAIGHDLLHGVFHVEGRIWHTLPELFFKPGRLTRRYIDGERAKFIAPLPLFLFSVFFMFAVFSLTPAANIGTGKVDDVIEKWREGNASAVAGSNRVIEKLRTDLADPALAAERRAELTKQIAELEASLKTIESLGRLKLLPASPEVKSDSSGNESPMFTTSTDVPAQDELGVNESKPDRLNFNWEIPEGLEGNKWGNALNQAQQNPQLLFYKVKTNLYKFSWALIPMSLPFMWLLFCWRRDIHLYDHTVFITYSLSFMMLLLVLLSIAGALGMSATLRASIFGVLAPLHLYKQIRYTYAVSALGTYLRLIVLSVFISIIATAFLMGLLVLGVTA